MPLLNFIKITVHGDLKWLGRCSDPEALWQVIHSEYTELSKDISAQQGLELAKQITILTTRINITNSIVYYLSVRGVIPELIQELKNMGYRIKGEDLKVDLERVISLSKSDHVKLAAANDAYSKLEKGEKATELTWYQMLSALAKHRQITSINPALITVMEYCAMHNEYKEYCDYMSRAHK